MRDRMGCNLVAYRRVSTQKQGRSGLGLEAQDALIHGFAERTHSTIVGKFVEIETGKNSTGSNYARLSQRRSGSRHR